MRTKDLGHNLTGGISIKTADHTATVSGEIIDLSGAEAFYVSIPVGTVAAADADNYMTFTVQVGDVATLTDAAAIASGSYIEPLTEAGATWDRIINLTTEGDSHYAFGFDAQGKRYARVVGTETGTFQGLLGASIIRGSLRKTASA